jgi:hypothetical protein
VGNPKHNSEGYSDPTAYEALKPIIQEDDKRRRRVSDFIDLMKRFADMCGYEIMNRVVLKDKKTGKEYR